MARIVIVGAGLTGISAAYHLEKNNYFDYVIFEQNEFVGGLCRTVKSDGFIFDYTGHYFHGITPEIETFFNDTMPSDQWNAHERRSFIYSHGIHTPYPYQTNLYGLPKNVIIDCIKNFVHRPKIKNTKTFDKWVIRHFGLGFARHFFFPYQEKIFDFPVNLLSAEWVGSIPETSLESIIEGVITKKSIDAIGYNAQFWYPCNGGIENLITNLKNKLKERKKIITNARVVSIDTLHKKILLNNGEWHPYEYIISTMPLDHLLTQIEHGCKKPYVNLAPKLLCNTVINLNIGFEHNSHIPYNWVYYPEKKYQFFRIGFPHTINKNMAPSGLASISAEIATLKKLSESDINFTIERTAAQIYDLFKIKKTHIKIEKILMLDHAYVIYDSWRDRHIHDIHQALDKDLIYSIGRYGAWKYSSMRDAILDGKFIAQMLTTKITCQQTATRDSIETHSL